MAFVRLSRGLFLVKSVSSLRSAPVCISQSCKRISPLVVAGAERLCAGFATNKDPKTLTEKEWIEKLTPEQFVVCREKGTEQPFSGKYYTHSEEGVYTCVACKNELFSSKVKYESGTGWPSFYDVVGGESSPSVLTRPDNSTGTMRTEVICRKCDAHLGHRFADGPQPTGTRYCINSVALNFTLKKQS